MKQFDRDVLSSLVGTATCQRDVVNFMACNLILGHDWLSDSFTATIHYSLTLLSRLHTSSFHTWFLPFVILVHVLDFDAL